MKNCLKIKFLAFASLSSLMFLHPTSNARASSYITKVDENGKVIIVEEVRSFRGTLECGGVKAIMSIDDVKGQKPSIMAVIVETDGSKTYPKRLTTEFNGFLESQHTMSDFKIGCLSGGGGIGMIFKASDVLIEPAHIQLDRSGRIFSNFNQTGFTLLPDVK